MNRVIALMCAFVLMCVFSSTVVWAEEEQPILKVERFFIHIDWASENAPDEVRRIRPRFTVGNGRCFGRVEFDLAKTDSLNHNNGNWLEIGEIVCSTSANSQLHVGRLFLSPPYSTPYPGALRTIEYAGAIPFTAFAYGIQWQVAHGKWWISTDLTGNSGRQFDDSGNFDRLESGVRIARTTDLGTFGFTAQGSNEFIRGGIDYTTDAKRRFGTWVGLYYNDQASVRPITGLALVSYQFGKFRPHMMYDWRSAGTEMLTIGTEFQWTKQVRLVGDYEVDDDRFLLRAQYRF